MTKQVWLNMFAVWKTVFNNQVKDTKIIIPNALMLS